MAEFQKVVQALNRMCNGRICEECPLHEASGGANCNLWMRENSRDAEALIMHWEIEHPIKTNGMKFEEVFGSCVEVVWHYEFNAFSKWADAEYKEVQE